MQENKLYKTVDELVEYLRENKRIFVTEDTRHWLEDINYVSLINPYKEIFASGKDQNGNHIYPHKVDFQELVNLLEIDNEFSKNLFEGIRFFERKFKNIVIHEICKEYAQQGDPECLSYIDETYRFLRHLQENKDSDQLQELTPRFCPNLFFKVTPEGLKKLSKDNPKLLESRISLLRKIYELGSGKDLNDCPKYPRKIIIRHYIKAYGHCPLWIIPNDLSFGEMITLFQMLSSESHHKIMKLFGVKFRVLPGKFEYRKISRFSGRLEEIRVMRNTVMHFEPIFPVLSDGCRHLRDIKNSKKFGALSLLFDGYVLPDITDEKTTLLKGIQVTTNNLIKVRIMELMVLFNKKANKKIASETV